MLELDPRLGRRTRDTTLNPTHTITGASAPNLHSCTRYQLGDGWFGIAAAGEVITPEALSVLKQSLPPAPIPDAAPVTPQPKRRKKDEGVDDAE